MNWASILGHEAPLSPVILSDELARKYGLSVDSVRRALSRQEDRGFVERVTKKVYLNKLTFDASAIDFVRYLRPKAYVSLEWALAHWGISDQSPLVLTCVTTGKPREYRTGSFTILFRTISPGLFWGFMEKQTRYGPYKFAEPEKALLDWIYLTLQEGLKPPVDEFDFRPVSRSKLLAYAGRYPSTVLKVLLPELSTASFAA